MTSRLPSSLAILQAVHEAGGETPYDIGAISARLGLPKMSARKYIGGCIDRELLMRIDRGTGPVLALTPTGLDAAVVRKPVQPVAAKPSRPPPSPSSAPTPSRPPSPSSSAPPPPPPTRTDDDLRDRAPLNEVQRIRLGKQRRELRALARLRGVAKIDGVDHNRLYDDALELGRDAKLTALEYQRLKTVLGRFPVAKPAGFSMEQAQALRDDFNRPGRTEAKRKSREAKTTEKAASVREVEGLDRKAGAVFTALTDKWKTAIQLSKVLKGSPAFYPTAGSSLKKAIRRVLDKLVTSGRVEMTSIRHDNGRPVCLFRLRQP